MIQTHSLSHSDSKVDIIATVYGWMSLASWLFSLLVPNQEAVYFLVRCFHVDLHVVHSTLWEEKEIGNGTVDNEVYLVWSIFIVFSDLSPNISSEPSQCSRCHSIYSSRHNTKINDPKLQVTSIFDKENPCHATMQHNRAHCRILKTTF